MWHFLVVILSMVTAALFAGEAAPKIDHLIYITTDGFRWQEFFGGAQDELMNKPSGGVVDIDDLEKRYGGATPQERREKLLPFVWGTVAKSGQIFGDPEKHSRAHVTNGLKFSYPGYSEMLCGFADPRINSNKKIPNPNLTVLEWLNEKPVYKDRVFAFGAWNVLPSIVNEGRSGLHVNIGTPPFPQPATEKQKAINEVAKTLPRYWADEVFDVLTMQSSLECLRSQKPKVLYVMLGETDEWAHGKRYDLYLGSARYADDFIKQVWEFVESDPEYKGRTALVLSTDHGRGLKPTDWTSHGKDIDGAENIWIALMAPGVAALGSRENLTVTQAQIAATLAALLGEDFKAAIPRVAEPLPLK